MFFCFQTLMHERGQKYFTPAAIVYMDSPDCDWQAAGSEWRAGSHWCQWCQCTHCYCVHHSRPGRWDRSLPMQQCTGLPPVRSYWCRSVPSGHHYLGRKTCVSARQVPENKEPGGQKLTWNSVVLRWAVIAVNRLQENSQRTEAHIQHHAIEKV